MQVLVFPLQALVFAIFLTSPFTALAAAPALDQAFDPADFTPAEIQILQRSLTFTGHYAGLWDGEWGPLSAGAVQSYSRANYGGADLINYGLIPLILDGMARIDELGWTETYLPRYDVTIGLPASIVREQYSSTGIAFLGEGLGVEVFIESPAELTAVHNNLARAAIVAPYTVRNDRRWVTAVRTDEGSSYLRSDWTGQSWVSLLIDAAPYAEDYLSYISSSYRFGPLEELEDAEIANLAQLLLRAVEEFEEKEGGAARGTGSGFFIAPDIIVTNYHVVAQCGRISTPDGLIANILASTEMDDLAVLRYSGRSASFLSVSTEDDIRLGKEVSAVGYPLYGLINTGLNFTTGVVSAINGFADNEANFTLTAPLQPGNSGGPVIDNTGAVLGVAVATASLRLAEIGGFIPQNINWAVKGSTLRRFLDSNGIEYQTNPQKRHIFDAGLPDDVAAAITPIVCD